RAECSGLVPRVLVGDWLSSEPTTDAPATVLFDVVAVQSWTDRGPPVHCPGAVALAQFIRSLHCGRQRGLMPRQSLFTVHGAPSVVPPRQKRVHGPSEESELQFPVPSHRRHESPLPQSLFWLQNLARQEPPKGQSALVVHAVPFAAPPHVFAFWHCV